MIEPRANPLFRGHESAVSAMRDAAQAGKLHHAWLITGAEGVGKASLAFRFARWLLAGATSADLAVDPANPVARRVAAGTHADLLTIERRYDEKKKRMQGEIVIDTVLESGALLRRTAGEGGWRIVVLDGAEDMNRNAANALLKLLEEPPHKSLWLIASHAPGRLLPTIRSRCRRINLGPLPDQTVDELLGIYAPETSEVDRRRIAEIAEGSIGRALALAGEGGVAMAGLVDLALDISTPLPAAKAQAMADQVAGIENGFAQFFSLLRSALSTRTRQDARHNKAGLTPRVTLWQELGRIAAETEGLNLDPRTAILVALNLIRNP